MTDNDYFKVLKSLVLFTNPKDCWMIGSSPLVLLSNGLSGKCYQEFKKEGFKQRDIDFLQTSKNEIVDTLKDLGTMTPTKIVNVKYNVLLDQRCIKSIENYTFKIGEGKSSMSKVIKCLTDGVGIEISIDVITLARDVPIKLALSMWPVSETKRNFGIYCTEESDIVFTELRTVERCIDLSAKTLCNTIETIKHLYHYNGSSKRDCYMTGDCSTREVYDAEKLHLEDNILGKHKRLMDVLNGVSVELIKPIHFDSYYYEDLPESIEKEDTTCTICLTHIKDVQNKLMVLKCGHIYCLGCLFPMLLSYLIMRHNRLNNTSSINEGETHNNKCPVCRTDIITVNDRNKIRNKELMVLDWMVVFSNI